MIDAIVACDGPAAERLGRAHAEQITRQSQTLLIGPERLDITL